MDGRECRASSGDSVSVRSALWCIVEDVSSRDLRSETETNSTVQRSDTVHRARFLHQEEVHQLKDTNLTCLTGLIEEEYVDEVQLTVLGESLTLRVERSFHISLCLCLSLS